MPLWLALIAGFVAIYTKVDGVHKQINSRMDELLAITKAQAHAEGVADEAARSAGVETIRREAKAEVTTSKPVDPLPVIDVHNDPPGQ